MKDWEILRVKVVGERQLDREMKRLQSKLSLKGGEWADYGARAVREGVVRRAQPFGVGKKALGKGESMVRKGMKRCFRVVSDSQRRRGVIRDIGAAKSFHAQRRNNRGRVPTGERRMLIKSVYDALLEELLGRVGMAKGSVGGGGDRRLVQKKRDWVDRWKKEGDAKRKKVFGGAEWKFSAEPPHVATSNVLGQKGVDSVMRRQKRVVYAEMKRDFRRELKRRERRVNGG